MAERDERGPRDTESVDRLLGELEEEVRREAPRPPPRSSLPPPLPARPLSKPPPPPSRPPTSSFKPPAVPRSVPPPPPPPRKTPGLGKPATLPPPRSHTAPGIAAPGAEPHSDDDTILAKSAGPSLESSARALAAQWEPELAQSGERSRKARLAYELGRLYEGPLRDLDKAHARYQTALSLHPDHVPSLRGARRVALARKDHRTALGLFDAEARITADSRRKAALLFAKARLLEDVLGEKAKAREVYATAAELDRTDASILKALEQRDLEAQDLEQLERTYEREANAIAKDPAQRAAIIVSRARLVEHAQGNADAAIELYETALRLDPNAAGALDALERLAAAHNRHRELIRALTRRVERSADRSERALALYRIGRIHAERLGNREEAIAALERALIEQPDDPLVLEELSALYERAERFDRLVVVLTRLAAATADESEQLALWHRVGQIEDERLARVEHARAAYERALALDPTYVPTLTALARVYEASAAWDALIAMHLAEAEEVSDRQRRAAAHARVADVLEQHMGQPEEAMAHHARALALASSYAPSFKALARLYAESGKHRELIDLHERAVEAGEPSTKIAHLFKIAAIFEDALGEHDQAAHTYRRVLELDAAHLGALHALERTLERAGRHAELVQALEREAALHKESARVVDLLLRAAEVLDTRLGDRDGAIARYRRVLSLDPKHAPSLGGLGRIYHRVGRWEDLLEIYDRELEIEAKGPGRAALLHKMGVLCEERLGDEVKALELFRRAVAEHRTHRASLTALARRLAAKKDFAGLAQVLEIELEGLTDRSAKARAAYRLGEVYERDLAQPDRAATAYELALATSPGYAPALDALARLRASQGAWRKLADQLEHEAADADAVRAADRIARAGELWERALGDPRRAVGCYERVLELAPEHLGALLALERLYRKLSRMDALARVYGALSRVLVDPGARVAVLRELARIEERGERRPTEIVSSYEAILALAPDDPGALDGLEALALERGDRALLADVDRRMGARAGDAKIASAYQTRLAESLEAAGDPSALDAYRAALDSDSENLGAAKGLARVAERHGAAEVLADASRREAMVTEEPRARAALLVRAAKTAHRDIGDLRGAVKDYERALELWPDDADAAAGLVDVLLSSGQVARATDRLSRAAAAAKSPERIASLWLDVARFQGELLNNLPAALTSLERVLRSAPTHVPALERVAAIHARQGRWSEAAQALATVVSLAPDRDVLVRAHLALARAWGDHLNDRERALSSLQAVLALEPDHPEALGHAAELWSSGGDHERAKEALAALAERASAGERTQALLRLAEIQAASGDDDAAKRSLALAIEGEGAASAAERFRPLAHGAADWTAYAGALRVWLGSEPDDPAAVRAAELELARVFMDELKRPTQAIEPLERGAKRDPGDVDLRKTLAIAQRAAGQNDAAAAELRSVVADAPGRADLWRALSVTLRAAGELDEARRALAPLLVLGVATPDEAREAAQTRTLRARPGSLDASILSALYNVQKNGPLAPLLRELLPGLGKLYPPDLDTFGLSSRDRLAKGAAAPIRRLADHVASVFGVPDFALYVHRARGRGVAIELAEPPAILVPSQLAELGEAHQAFTLARALSNVAMGLHAVDKLTPRELEIILAANARRVVPGFGAGLTSEEILDDIGKRLAKVLPRRSRKTVEDLSRAYAGLGELDFAQVASAMHIAASRAALLVSDDLAAAIDVIRRTERDAQELEGARLVSHPSVSRIVRFFCSQEACAIRRRMGLSELTGPTNRG
jgi:tetratricopeptide (TPR) repeat protein